MAKHSEPNAQNSELDPKTHPSGARIEKMMNRASNEKSQIKEGSDITHRDAEQNLAVEGQETGTYGDKVRDSEKPNSYLPTEDTAEGDRDQVTDGGHRGSRQNREV